MRNVVLIMTASIDGFVVAPMAHIGELPEPEELKRWKLNRIQHAGTHIMGRVTYEEMAGFWPTSTDDYAGPMNEIPKVVFSKTLTETPWPDSSIARGNLADEIASLKSEPGVKSSLGEVLASLRRSRGRDSLTNTPSWTGTMLNICEPRGWGTQG